MKVLILTYYWPPAGGSGVQRWLKFTKYFRDFGVEPIIYTVENPNYPIEDTTLLKEIPKNIEVLKQPIWEPNSIFSGFGKNKRESAGFLNSKPSYFGKILQYIRANYFIPDARRFWVKPSIKFLKKYLSEHKIDVIITTGPPHSVHLIGLRLKEELNVKWIADFRDPWTEIDYFHHLPLTKKSIKKHFKLEKEVVSKADSVVVVGNTMNKNFKKFNKNVVTITNGFDINIEDSVVSLDEKFTMTHIGLMNADRNPKMLWETISELCTEDSDFKTSFQLNLIGKVDASIIEVIEKLKLTGNIKLIDYLPHSEVLTHQKKSQVLLLVVNNVPSAKGIITGKIFEYLAVKRPVLAIAPKDGDLAEILNESNAGVVIDFKDKIRLKKSILEMFSKYKLKTFQVNSKGIEKYHRKNLTKKVSDIIFKIAK